MTTKKVEYWIDLVPNWHCKEQMQYGSPGVHGSLPPFPAPEDWKRVKVIVELPIFGDDVDGVVVANSEIEKSKGFHQDG